MIMFLLIAELVALVMLIVILLYDCCGERLLFSKDKQTEYKTKKQANERTAIARKASIAESAMMNASQADKNSKGYTKMDITDTKEKKP